MVKCFCLSFVGSSWVGPIAAGDLEKLQNLAEQRSNRKLEWRSNPTNYRLVADLGQDGSYWIDPVRLLTDPLDPLDSLDSLDSLES